MLNAESPWWAHPEHHVLDSSLEKSCLSLFYEHHNAKLWHRWDFFLHRLRNYWIKTCICAETFSVFIDIVISEPPQRRKRDKNSRCTATVVDRWTVGLRSAHMQSTMPVSLYGYQVFVGLVCSFATQTGQWGSARTSLSKQNRCFFRCLLKSPKFDSWMKMFDI